MQRKEFRRYALLLVVLAMAGAAGCNKLKARDNLNKGVAAYKGGQFDQAIDYFQKAKELDPGLMNARLYLATALASQYIPGAPSDENIRTGQQAIAEYEDVLKEDPNNLSAIDGIGSILYNMGGTPFDPKKFDDSKSYHMKHIQLKPEDPEPYYWIGVIDWSVCFRGNKEMRAQYNANAKKQLQEIDGMPAQLSHQFGEKYGTVIQEGIDNLNKAIQLRPDYDDAMAYLNLLLRQKADMEISADAREADKKQADDLVKKAMTIRQHRMEAPAQS